VARRRGYEQAMSAAGLAEFIRIAPGDLTEEDGYRAGIELIAGPGRPSAIFAVNDMAALGVISAAEERGLSVPKDLSVAGYDNTPLARLRRISLTSVDNSSYAAGARAAQLLLARLVPGGTPPENELLPPVLEIRGSTAAPGLAGDKFWAVHG
jgi:DNA-binding LacI/PurR family transcriptional regulator